MAQSPCVMVNHHHRIALVNQSVYDVHKTINIRRMQAYRRLIEDKQCPGCTAAHRFGKLDTLPLAI